MTFTAGNLFPSHSCIGVTWVKPPPVFEPGSRAWELDKIPTELSLPLVMLCYIGLRYVTWVCLNSLQETCHNWIHNVFTVTLKMNTLYNILWYKNVIDESPISSIFLHEQWHTITIAHIATHAFWALWGPFT